MICHSCKTLIRRCGLLLGLVLWLAAAAWAGAREQTLYSFGGNQFSPLRPFSGVIFDKDGNLYGVASQGGLENRGAVYELSPSANGWTEKTLYSFGAFYPNAAALIFDRAGNLYSIATEGGRFNGGVVFELTPTSSGPWSVRDLHDFGGSAADGKYPEGTLIMDSSGNLYGTTLGGSGAGCVFELFHSSAGWEEQVLYTFQGGDDGGAPYGALTFDSAGNLYGTTELGGADHVGVIFELKRSGVSWRETALYSFQGGTDGSMPLSNVIFDAAGNLYGTTWEGGASNLGTVFELSPAGSDWTEKIIHDFSGNDGEFPVTGLILSRGALYGSAQLGGPGGDGTVFSLKPNSDGAWAFKVTYAFGGPSGGDYPSGLVADSAGNLYGANPYGGNGNGAVFEIEP